MKYKKFKLHELFTSKLARKALVSLLFAKDYSIDRIATITNHSIDAIKYYLQVMENPKEKMMEDIKKEGL